MVALEKFKESRDRGDEFGPLFTDICKTFLCIHHNLLITKLSWNGVTIKSLHLIFSHLKSWMQRARINISYSNKHEIIPVALQELALGPLLFDIDLIGLFLECENDNINSYVDDTTPYCCPENMSSVITELQRIANKIFSWFENNHLSSNNVMLSYRTTSFF